MILGVLQARVTSTRLPGKVLKPLAGQAMILRQIERLYRTRLMNSLVVATSTDQSDDQLDQLLRDNGIPCYRGDLNDVLDRFYRAAASYNPLHVIRFTADCPLTDPEVNDQVIQFHLDGGYDYTSNSVEPTFPDGLDIEVMKFKALERAWNDAYLTSQREHVTPYLYKTMGLFKTAQYKQPVDLSMLRWTVDTEEDYTAMAEVYNSLYTANPRFGMREVLGLLRERPEINLLNAGQARNEGYAKSLANDAVAKTLEHA